MCLPYIRSLSCAYIEVLVLTILYTHARLLEDRETCTTPLHIACAVGNAPVALVLLDEMFSTINVVDRWGKTPLHLTALASRDPSLSSSSLATAHALLAHGADGHVTDDANCIPLQYATPEMRLLLETATRVARST